MVRGGDTGPARRPAAADAAAERAASGSAPGLQGTRLPLGHAEVKGRLRKSLSKWASSADMEARELKEDAVKAGCCPIADADDRQRVELRGSLRTVTLRPRGGVPALEAELYDGSGADHPGLARPPPDRGHRARPRDQGGRPGRRAGRDAGDVQPPLRAEVPVSETARRTPAPDGPSVPTRSRRSSGPSCRKALGGRRGMLEAAVPTLAFTLVFLARTKDLRLAVVRQRRARRWCCSRSGWCSARRVQFVLNSLVGIGIGAFFAWRSARGGGDANEQALAYFLPGILYNGGYAVLMALSILVRWPLVGFMVGSVAGDPTAWHRDPQVVRLCRNLTWMLAAALRGPGRGAGADLPRRQGRRRRRPVGRRARRHQDRDGLAAADRSRWPGWPGCWPATHTPVEPPSPRPAWSWTRRRWGRAGPGASASPSGELDEQQLVAGLDGLLAVGRVDLAVAQDRDQRAVLRPRDQARRACRRTASPSGSVISTRLALPWRKVNSRTRSPTVTASSTRADMIRGVETLTSTPQASVNSHSLLGWLTRADRARHAELGLGQQRGDQVGLVVTGRRDHHVARPRAGPPPARTARRSRRAATRRPGTRSGLIDAGSLSMSSTW